MKKSSNDKFQNEKVLGQVWVKRCWAGLHLVLLPLLGLGPGHVGLVDELVEREDRQRVEKPDLKQERCSSM